MVGQEGNKTKRKPPLKYFYLNGQLHKKLHIDRPRDTITTWCYPLRKRVAYTWSDVKRMHRPAFKTKEVCKMVNRSLRTVEGAVMDGFVEPPQSSYSLNTGNNYGFWWSEEDVLNLHRYLSTRHRGRPRKDGLVTAQAMPSERELRAIMRNEEVMYVRTDDGEFRPVWRAEDFS